MADDPFSFEPRRPPHDPPPRGRSHPSRDPSVEHEPHLRGEPAELDPSERRAAETVRRAARGESEADVIERSVWDEPALTAGLAPAAPEGAPTYAEWLTRKIAETTPLVSWRTTLLIVLSAGPWGVVGAIIAQMSAGELSFGGALAAIVVAPVTEEIAKVAAALWVVEKRPYLFVSPVQIMLCAAAGGLAFATIENVMYLYVYTPAPSAAFALWRWTVCTGLHLGCSSLAGVALVRIWRAAISERRRPELALGAPWFTAAMVCHGLYNTAALFGELTGVLEF